MNVPMSNNWFQALGSSKVNNKQYIDKSSKESLLGKRYKAQ